MISASLAWDRYTVLGRFCALLLGVALTWTCAIYGLLVVTSSPCGNRSWKIAQGRVREAEQAIAMYVIDNGRCPGTIDDLIAHRYLSQPGTEDPWVTTIAFSCSADDWSARSAGPDRLFGTADDITSRY